MNYVWNIAVILIGYSSSSTKAKIVVLFNGFQKKTLKTPQSEIEKVLKIKEAYYGDKQS